MRDIKAVFFDIDGTLRPLGSDHIMESTKRSIRALQKKGILTGIATGRNMFEIKASNLIQDMEFPFLVTINGGIVWEGDKVIHRCPIEKAEIQKVLAMCEEDPFAIGFNEESEVYLNLIDDTVRLTHEFIKTPPFPVQNPVPRALENDVYQLMIYATHERMDKIMANLENVKATQWHKIGFDIGSNLSNKGVGIEAAVKQHGIRLDQVVSFGDGMNDIDMLQNTGIGIAMGNASEQVKQHADYVCERDVDDGVTKALVRLGLLTEAEIQN